MTSPEEPTAPRTWMPLALAGAIALLVILGAFVASALRSGMSEGRADAVRACEAAYAASGADGEVPVPIVAGDVYGASEWREQWEFLRQQQVIDAAPGDEDAAALDARAEELAAAESDLVTVVWWLETEEHLQCTVVVEGERAVAETVEIGPLAPLG